MSEQKVLYRYELTHYSRTNIVCYRFPVIRETLKGCWVSMDIGGPNRPAYSDSGDKWVSNSARSRFAFPTKEEAFKHCVARNARHIAILEARLRDAKRGRALLSRLTPRLDVSAPATVGYAHRFSNGDILADFHELSWDPNRFVEPKISGEHDDF